LNKVDAGTILAFVLIKDGVAFGPAFRRVKGVRRIGVRVGNWLTAEQGKRLLAGPDRQSLRGKRNYALLAMLIGCGLRRGEVLALRVDAVELRESAG
jgi:integrase